MCTLLYGQAQLNMGLFFLIFSATDPENTSMWTDTGHAQKFCHIEDQSADGGP